MKRGRLLLPWGLLAGLLLWSAAIDGLSIKAPSLLKKPRNLTASQLATTSTTTTTAVPTLAEAESAGEDEVEEAENVTEAEGNVTKSLLTGDPQNDYKYDPNLPRELPIGYNLSQYPFFSRVPNDVEFECGEELLDGYYANVHYKCQVYHHCLSGIRYDFLCANYTAFDQKTFICHFVSEVDCINSAKHWNRNKGLYETPTTSTVKPLTLAPHPALSASRRPSAAAAGGGGRRRRPPYRRRRPAYDYYYDDEYDDDEYEDDVTAPGQSGGRGAGQRSRPQAPAPADQQADGPLFKADASIYDRPRQAPKIRRPVPKNERDKYEYSPKEAAANEKRKNEDEYDRPADRDYDRPKRPQESSDYDKPRGQDASRSRQKQRPVQEDDEYYDDEDEYEQPRTSSRKNNQDYYAPSGQDRDFVRRPAMNGAGRPLRRNRPGARRRPIDEDYYDDRRSSRPTGPAEQPRRRPSARDEEPRRRPSVEEDEPRKRRPAVDEEEPRKRRPAVDEEEPRKRRPAVDEEEPRKRRPAVDEEEPRKRRPTVEEEEPRKRKQTVDEDEPRKRRPAVDEDEPKKRRPTVEEEEPRKRRPTTPAEEEPRKRTSAVSEDDRSRRPSASEEEPRRSAENPRKRGQQRDERDDSGSDRSQSSKESTRPLSGRDNAYERPLSTSRDTSYEKAAIPLSTGRESSYERPLSRDSTFEKASAPLTTGRESSYEKPLTSNRDTSFEKISATLSTGRESSYDRPLSRDVSSRTSQRDTNARTPQRDVEEKVIVKEITHERGSVKDDRSRSNYDSRHGLTAPSGSGSTNVRPLASRIQNTRVSSAESNEPIPASKPAYISTTDRGSIRKDESRVPPTGTGGYRGSSRHAQPVTSTTTTELPLLDDEEYYDDDEEIEEELPQMPTGSGRIGTGGYQETTSKEELPLPPVRPLRTPLIAANSNEKIVEEVTQKAVPVPEVREHRRIGPITREQAKAKIEAAKSSQVEDVKPKEVQGSGTAKNQTGIKRPISSSYHFNADDVLVETSTRARFRPKVTTASSIYEYAVEVPTPSSHGNHAVRPVTEQSVEDTHPRPKYQANFRRKSNQASNIETTQVLPTKSDLKDLELDVPLTAPALESIKPVVNVDTTYQKPQTISGFESTGITKPFYESSIPTGPSAKSKSQFRKNFSSRIPDDFSRRPILPDITDPEYDVTLNEAVLPTQDPLEGGAPRIKIKVPIYNYREPDLSENYNKKSSTIFSSASQTHVTKTPYPVHGKYITVGPQKVTAEYDEPTNEDDYDDTSIPTGRGATKQTFDFLIPSGKGVSYEWTTLPSVGLRGSEDALPTSSSLQYNNNGRQQYRQQQQQPKQQQQQQQHQQQRQQPQQQQQQQQQPQQQQQSQYRGTLREFDQQSYVPPVRTSNHQYYKVSPGMVRETDLYNGPLNPVAVSLGYDYDSVPKYRPRRKYLHEYYGKPY